MRVRYYAETVCCEQYKSYFTYITWRMTRVLTHFGWKVICNIVVLS